MSHNNRKMDTEYVVYYPMEYHSAIKNDDILRFAGKWNELQNIILIEVTQNQKKLHDINSLISEYHPIKYNKRIQSLEIKKVNKQKIPSDDTSIPLWSK